MSALINSGALVTQEDLSRLTADEEKGLERLVVGVTLMVEK